MKKRIQAQGFLIFLASILTILMARTLVPVWRGEFWEETFDSIGIVTILLGFLIRISARGIKAEQSQQKPTLCTSGPYAQIQHPMYFGTFLIGLGAVFILLQLWMILIFLGVYLAIYIPQVNRETQKMKIQFTEKFKIYAAATPKYIPKLSTLFRTKLRISLPCKWAWVRKELPSLLATLGLIIFLEIWEDLRLFGVLECVEEFAEFALIIIIFVDVVFYINRQNQQSPTYT